MVLKGIRLSGLRRNANAIEERIFYNKQRAKENTQKMNHSKFKEVRGNG